MPDAEKLEFTSFFFFSPVFSLRCFFEKYSLNENFSPIRPGNSKCGFFDFHCFQSRRNSIVSKLFMGFIGSFNFAFFSRKSPIFHIIICANEQQAPCLLLARKFHFPFAYGRNSPAARKPGIPARNSRNSLSSSP